MCKGIDKYIIKTVCVIMLLLVQFDICAPLLDTIPFFNETTVEYASPTGDEEEMPGDETYYFNSNRTQVPNIRLLAHTLDTLVNLFPIPQVLVQTYPTLNEHMGNTVQPHIVFCVYRI